MIAPNLNFQYSVHLNYMKKQVEGQGLTSSSPEDVGMLTGDTVYSTSDGKHNWCFCAYSEEKNVRVRPQRPCFLFGTH